MSFLLWLIIVAYFCFVVVNCRSVPTDDDGYPALEQQKDTNHDSENGGRFSWKKLKPMLRREVQRIRNIKDMQAKKMNKESAEPAISANPKVNENPDRKETSLKAKSANSSHVKSELANSSMKTEPIRNLNMTEERVTDITNAQGLTSDPFDLNDFSSNAISDILNRTSDSIFLQVLNDNSTNIDSLEFDETSVLSAGGHVATLQEVSTIGFELLIDSETKQNLLLTQLINSEASSVEKDDFLDKEDSRFTTLGFSNKVESELLATVKYEEPNSNAIVTEYDTNEIDTGKTELGTEVETKGTEFDLDVDEDETAKFDAEDVEDETTEFDVENVDDETTEFVNEVEAETSEFDVDDAEFETSEFDIDDAEFETSEFYEDDAEAENTDFDAEDVEYEKTEFDANEVKTESTEFEMKKEINKTNLSELIQKNDATEISNPEPKCPDPGWCIFWFLALDTCAKDSHCHGSLICCMIGCSKTCVDNDS